MLTAPHPKNDAEIVERLKSAPLGVRELLPSGRVGTKVGNSHGLPILCDADGKYLCPHGEYHAVMRACKLKSPLCDCRPITKHQENLLNENLSQYKFGLQGETVCKFLQSRREEHPPFAFGNVHINGSDQVVCSHGNGLQTFNRRNERINTAVNGMLRQLTSVKTVAEFEKFKCASTEKRADSNAFALCVAISRDAYPADVFGAPPTDVSTKAWADFAKNEPALHKSFYGCMCAKPTIPGRAGAVVRYNKAESTPRVSMKRPVTTTPGVYGHVAVHSRSKCADCEKPIDLGSLEYLMCRNFETKKGKKTETLGYHAKCLTDELANMIAADGISLEHVSNEAAKALFAAEEERVKRGEGASNEAATWRLETGKKARLV